MNINTGIPLRILLVVIYLGFLSIVDNAFARSLDFHKAIEIIERFNSIKSYAFQQKLYLNGQLEATSEVKHFAPNLFKEKSTIFSQSKTEIATITVIDGRDQWIYHPLRHSLERFTVSPEYKAINYYIGGAVNVKYMGEKLIDGNKADEVRVISKEPNKSVLTVHFLYFDHRNGVLKQLEDVASNIKMIFYNYQFNLTFDPKEFQFIKPNDLRIFYDHSSRTKDQSNLKKDIKNYIDVIKIDPNNIDAYSDLGYAYGKLGNFNQSISAYSKAIEINSTDAEMYYDRGISYRYQGNCALSVDDFTKAITINPQYWKAYFNRGYSYAKLGQYDKAIADYTQSIEINANNKKAYYNRSLIYCKKSEFALALSDLNKAIEIDSNYSVAYDNRAAVYYYLKQYDKAWLDVRKEQQFGATLNSKFIGNLEKMSGKSL